MVHFLNLHRDVSYRKQAKPAGPTQKLTCSLKMEAYSHRLEILRVIN